MTGEEFSAQRRLLDAYEELANNYAFKTEMSALFARHLADAISGLRDRNISREKRDEHLVAAENAEVLVRYVDKRTEQLRASLTTAAADTSLAEQE